MSATQCGKLSMSRAPQTQPQYADAADPQLGGPDRQRFQGWLEAARVPQAQQRPGLSSQLGVRPGSTVGPRDSADSEVRLTGDPARLIPLVTVAVITHFR